MGPRGHELGGEKTTFAYFIIFAMITSKSIEMF
jgi:hypothetical protein